MKKYTLEEIRKMFFVQQPEVLPPEEEGARLAKESIERICKQLARLNKRKRGRVRAGGAHA